MEGLEGLRAVAIERLSKSADPASTSFERQDEIVLGYIKREKMIYVDTAKDEAVSAFHIPPEKRKAVRYWLARPDEFDCFVYWRQDRLVRRTEHFMGLISWCKQHGKKLYSATEGLGDVTQHAGVLIGFITAWQSEGESAANSLRTQDSRKKLAQKGRWPGGRKPYFARALAIKDEKGDTVGWELVADMQGGGKRCREAALTVISGKSVNSIVNDFNRRSVPTTTGAPWSGTVLRELLRNRGLLDLGVLNATEWADLQAALNRRSANRTVRTTGAESHMLDVVFCGQCGGKLYRSFSQKKKGTQRYYYARCRNSIHRDEARRSCTALAIQYDLLVAMVSVEMSLHADELIMEPVTRGDVRLRLNDIAKELLGELPAEFATKLIDRDQFLKRQEQLMDEQEQLEREEGTTRWRETDETVGQRWERLSDAERRLWLLRIGTKFYLHQADKRWELRGVWQSAFEAGRLKIIQAAI